MPHDRNGKRIAVGDFVKVVPYNTHGQAPVIGRVADIKEEQSCSGRIVWPAIGEMGSDFFGAEDCELVLRANGEDPQDE